MKRILSLSLLALTVAGCLNPYASEFSCPETDLGKCVSVTDAYQESRGAEGGSERSDSEDYREALFDRLAGLLDEPETPLVVPPKVMRVLMLPYEGQEEELYLFRYAYIFTDRPRWVLSNELTELPRGGD